MTRRNFIVLHKNEWERLKSKGKPPQESKKPSQKEEYMKSLQETSQSWIKKWPDSVEGHITELENKKEKQRLKDIALIKLFKKNQKSAKKNEIIEKAKQMIFEDSCYGRRLISALLESKALEERDIQIEFQKKLSDEAKERDKNSNHLGCSLHNPVEMEKKEKEHAIRNREKNEEIAKINKAMYMARNESDIIEKERQRLCMIHDLKVMKQLIEEENTEKSNKKVLLKQDLLISIADRKEAEERRKQREIDDERRAKQWKDYEERRNRKIDMIYKKIISNPSQSSKNYELIDKLKKEEAARYNEFVNLGIERLKSRELAQEQEDKNKSQNKLKVDKLLMESNKKIAVLKVNERNQKISICDKQCLIPKCKNTRKINMGHNQVPSPTQNSTEVKNTKPGWSGNSAAHAYFAREANEILQQCRYKNMVRKVVDDYRRHNNLNTESLPIANYF